VMNVVRGAIYARYSSDNQREESIAAQIYDIKEYARCNQISVVQVYTDEAKSATTDNRPGFLGMIEDAKKGLFDVLLVHKLDRFARNRYDSAFYRRELNLAGVKLVSITEKLDDSPESVILESVIEGMAEYYSKNLAREAMKGLKENARHCKHNGGRPPLGLDVDVVTREYVPSANEREVEAVKLIFDMYHNGHSYMQIVRECNLRGYVTKTGQQFAKNGLHDILRNEKYIGTYVYNRSAGKNGAGKRNNHLSKPDDEMFRVENAFPAIVDRELFLAVQDKMRRNKRCPGRNKAKVAYLLSGLIICECGAAMVGSSSSYRTKAGLVRKYYYECNKRDRQGNDVCDNKGVSKKLLEDLVFEKLRLEFFQQERVVYLVRRLNERNQEEAKEAKEGAGFYRGVLADVKRQIEVLVSAIAGGAPFEPLTERLGQLQMRKVELETRIAEVEVLGARESISEEMIEGYLGLHRKAVENKDIVSCKKFIHNYVDNVVVDREFVTVNFYFNVCGYRGGGGGYRSKTTVHKKDLKLLVRS